MFFDTLEPSSILVLYAQRPASPVAPMSLTRQRRHASRHLVNAMVICRPLLFFEFHHPPTAEKSQCRELYFYIVRLNPIPC